MALSVLAGTASANQFLTERVADINPGPSASAPRNLVDSAGTVFFAASDGVHGEELWRSDGTVGGTAMVEDIDPAFGDSSSPAFITPVGGQVFFRADDGVSGLELWRSDGTAAGTQLVEDIAMPPEVNKAPNRLAEFNGILLFTVDGGQGRELWRSDGTAAGTHLVEDINPGSAGSNTSPIVDAGDYALFGADNGSHGFELWRTDGTAAGTFMVEDIVSGATGSSAQPLATVNGVTYLFVITPAAGSELWRSDGTAAGTFMVKDIRPGVGASSPSAPIPVASGLVFAADDGVHGVELWRTDGTESGTQLLADISPGPASSQPFSAAAATSGGRTVFAAEDGAHGIEPWVTDGTAVGTTPLGDLSPGPGDGVETIVGFAAQSVGDRVFFAGGGPDIGNELWSTDGTPSGTALVRDIEPEPGVGSFPGEMVASAGRLFFSADDGVAGLELWRSQHLAEPVGPPGHPPIGGPPALTGPVAPQILGKKWTMNRKGVVTLRMRCPASQASGPCAGTVRIATRRKVALNKRKRKLTLVKGRYAVPAGKTRKIRLKLRKGKRALVIASKAARRVT